MPTVKFINEKKEIEVPVGTKIRNAALMAGVNVYQGVNGYGAGVFKYLNCHGLGACGSCAVNVVKGMENTSQPGVLEKLKFKLPMPDLPLPCCFHYLGNEATMRLACQTRVTGDVEVETAPAWNLCGDNFFS